MKYRIKFSKHGSMKFIGHLDVMRYFQKAFRRSRIEVKLSEGFSPHQIMSFASPLGIGLTTDGDYLDVTLVDDTLTTDYIFEKLQAEMNGEINLVHVSELSDDAKNSMSIVCACDYEVFVKPDKLSKFSKEYFSNLSENAEKFLEQETIVVTKKTKKSEKEMDIKEYIYEFRGVENKAHSSDDSTPPNLLFMRLTSGSVLNIKPELVMESFCKFLSIPYDFLDYQINRTEMYADKNAVKGQVNTLTSEIKCDLVPLEDFN